MVPPSETESSLSLPLSLHSSLSSSLSSLSSLFFLPLPLSFFPLPLPFIALIFSSNFLSLSPSILAFSRSSISFFFSTSARTFLRCRHQSQTPTETASTEPRMSARSCHHDRWVDASAWARILLDVASPAEEVGVEEEVTVT
ncbi:hypothetical protein L202_01904 [Cryptococcus amylolentus CBS 6039]|uniref:Uncharacterized protein n=1 Tax=Cryptococcus amylolentus CBS 6039 TaxID=1295533 RepID=A0A1E3HYR4_9TREE|nr:hypothetical protein L202_01904 [Cryptococcus amylolentus CBS 6039]ODN81480.1 hypothetical protein L202_01904 [Cryptococcus amylolentus CBS 6039]